MNILLIVTANVIVLIVVRAVAYALLVSVNLSIAFTHAPFRKSRTNIRIQPLGEGYLALLVTFPPETVHCILP